VGIVDGMGKETGLPSMMGLGHPPAVLSKPFRLKMIFTVTLVGFTVRPWQVAARLIAMRRPRTPPLHCALDCRHQQSQS
jgi:hypothetical protein